jgi:Domain of unknown function (DUF4291)
MTESQVPYRQVRALYDDDTITVYQAYNEDIAKAAVEKQRLDASPLFKHTRMTWIKPSWAWVNYRAGYSYKDPGQARILALKMKHTDFQNLLRRGELTIHGPGGKDQSKPRSDDSPSVNIQWDPERAPNLDKLAFRSIQIGIPAASIASWVSNEIVAIEDVTERARNLKVAVDKNRKTPLETLVAEGLVPEERPYELPPEIQKILGMDQKA